MILVVRLSRNPEMIKLEPQQIKDIISAAADCKKIIALFLFGSYGTEKQTPLSDVDLAFLPKDGDFELEKELSFMSKLEEIAKTEDINAVNLRKASIELQIEIISSGQLLYSRDEHQLADFKEQVIKFYCDIEPDLRNFFQDYDEGLREEFL